MPKAKGKGGKNRRRGKNEADDDKRELVFKDDGQEYAQVVKMLGNGRIEAKCFDGVTRLAHIRGKMRKKVWIAQGDIILLSLRDFQDDKADVIVKYTPDEARDLKNYGELPASAIINENEAGPDDDEGGDIEFGIDEDEIDDICESARFRDDVADNQNQALYHLHLSFDSVDVWFRRLVCTTCTIAPSLHSSLQPYHFPLTTSWPFSPPWRFS